MPETNVRMKEETSSPTVVILDDDPLQLELLSETLIDAGYRVYSFNDGEEALGQIQWFPPDVVVTDFHMPLMSGLEFLKALNDRMGDEAPPCLVLSASKNEQDAVDCYQYGAKDFIAKPFTPGVLLAKLQHTVGRLKSEIQVPESRRPTRINDYRIVDEIGRGGMGVVFKVEDSDGYVFALKTLTNQTGNPDMVLRFRREIDILSTLSHPNLVRVYSAGKTSKLFYYCMDYIDGQPLDSSINNYQPLEARLVARILHDIADALDYLHNKDILHRDLKPGNVMVREHDQKPFLVDFGLAKFLLDNQLTAHSQIVGTPQYMSPEQILGKGLDGRSDLFSLGFIALEALIGDLVIPDVHPYACMSMIVRGDFPHAVNYDYIPPGLAAIVDKLLVTDRDQRYQNAGELKQAAAEWLASTL